MTAKPTSLRESTHITEITERGRILLIFLAHIPGEAHQPERARISLREDAYY
jgi:hypothetical protein